MADDTNTLLEQLINQIKAFDSRLDGIDHRLEVMAVNWDKTLRTWVRLETQGAEQGRELDRVKKNNRQFSPTWIQSTTKSDY